jgi:hypothetical protein
MAKFAECPFRNCLENNWRGLDVLCLVALEGEMGPLRPVLATCYTPDRRLFGFSGQSLRNCPKRGRNNAPTLIWPVCGARNGSKRSVSAALRATPRAPPRLFGRFRKTNSRKLGRTPSLSKKARGVVAPALITRSLSGCPSPSLLGVGAVGASTLLSSRRTKDERRFARWQAIYGQPGIFAILYRSGGRVDGALPRASKDTCYGM